MPCSATWAPMPRCARPTTGSSPTGCLAPAESPPADRSSRSTSTTRATRRLPSCAPTSGCRSTLPELRGGETRRLLVARGDAFQLLARHHVVDVGEALRRALLGDRHHLLGPVLAVEQHDVGGL